MFTRRPLLRLVLVLAYALGSVAPAWPALAQGQLKPGAGCGMRACSMDHKDGEVCLCLLRPELLQAPDGACAMRAQGCGHADDHGSTGLAPMRPHLRPQRLGLTPTLHAQAIPAQPRSDYIDFVPAPLERPPQA